MQKPSEIDMVLRPHYELDFPEDFPHFRMVKPGDKFETVELPIKKVDVWIPAEEWYGKDDVH